jgi:hypothetical protein
MTFSKREVTRRRAITATILGTLAAGYPLSLQAAEPTAQEKANIQGVNDFCEAWRIHDVTKAWHGTGVFFLKSGRIVEWFDYKTFTDPAWSCRPARSAGGIP